MWEYTDEAHANKIQYAGAYYETSLGIYRMGVRWYDPGLGRFTNPDPSTKETNPYLYVAGNGTAVDLVDGGGVVVQAA